MMMGPLKILLLLPALIASAQFDSEYPGGIQKVYPTTLSHYKSFSGGHSYASASAAASASAYSSTGSSYARSSAAASSSAGYNSRYYQQQSNSNGVYQQRRGSRRSNSVAGYAGGHHTGMRGLDTAASKGQNSGLVLDQSLRSFYVRGSDGQGQVESHEGRTWRQRQNVQHQQSEGLDTARHSEFTGRSTGPRGYQQPTRSSYQKQPTQSSYQQQPTRSSYQQQPTRSSYQQHATRSSYQELLERSSYQQQPTRSSYPQQSTGLINHEQSGSSSNQQHVGSRYSGQSAEGPRDTPQFGGSGRYVQESRGLEQSSTFRQSIGPNGFQQLNVMKGQQKPIGSRGELRFTSSHWQQSEEAGDNLLQVTKSHSPLPSVQNPHPAPYPNPTVATLRPKYIYQQRINEQTQNGYQSSNKGSTCFYISCYSK